MVRRVGSVPYRAILKRDAGDVQRVVPECYCTQHQSSQTSFEIHVVDEKMYESGRLNRLNYRYQSSPEVRFLFVGHYADKDLVYSAKSGYHIIRSIEYKLLLRALFNGKETPSKQAGLHMIRLLVDLHI